MKKKMPILIAGIVILALLIVLVIVTNKSKLSNDDKSNSNIESNSNVEIQKETISINYKKYLELRSKAHEKETLAILIVNNDDVSKTFEEEVLYSFKDLKSKVYKIDVTSLKESEYSQVIDDVTKVFKYKKAQIIIPTLLVSKNGKIVYKKAGLAYSPEITENLKKNKIG